MSIKKISAVFDMKMDDPVAKFILVILADHYNESTGECWPSIDRIATISGCSKRTVIRKLKLLEATGRITRQKRYKQSDLYQIVWGDNLSGQTFWGDNLSLSGVTGWHTNPYIEPLPINKGQPVKKKAQNLKKQKLADWEPDDDCKRYAHDLGLDWQEVWTNIQLWDAQNGHKAAYSSLTAFWQRWCRTDAKSAQRPANAPSQQKRQRGLSDRQKEYAHRVSTQLWERYKSQGFLFDMIHKDVLAFMQTDQTDADWLGLGNGLDNPRDLGLMR